MKYSMAYALAASCVLCGCAVNYDAEESVSTVAQKLGGGWSDWLAHNSSGTETYETFTDLPSASIIEMKGYEQSGYGLVNLLLQVRDAYGTYGLGWTTVNFNGSLRSVGVGVNDQAIGVAVQEQYGYGLIDARILTDRGPTGWLTNNPDGNRQLSAICDLNSVLGGIQVREQSGYGVVDLRIYCKAK